MKNIFSVRQWIGIFVLAIVLVGLLAGVWQFERVQQIFSRAEGYKTFAFSGSGFIANEKLSTWVVFENGQALALPQQKADANGNVTFVALADEAKWFPGTVQIVAHGMQSKKEVVQSAQYRPPPKAIVNTVDKSLEAKACAAAGGEPGPIIIHKPKPDGTFDDKQCTAKCCYESCQYQGTCGADQPPYVPPPSDGGGEPELQGSADCQTTAPDSAACAGDKAWGDCINRTNGDSVQCGFEAANAYTTKLEELQKKARKSENPALALSQLAQQNSFDNIETYLRRAAACKDEFGKPLSDKSQCLDPGGGQVDLPTNPKDLEKVVNAVYAGGTGCQQGDSNYAKCVAVNGGIAVNDLKTGKLDQKIAAANLAKESANMDWEKVCVDKDGKPFFGVAPLEGGTDEKYGLDCKNKILLTKQQYLEIAAIEQRKAVLQACGSNKIGFHDSASTNVCYSCVSGEKADCGKIDLAVQEDYLVNQKINDFCGFVDAKTNPARQKAYENCVAKTNRDGVLLQVRTEIFGFEQQIVRACSGAGNVSDQEKCIKTEKARQGLGLQVVSRDIANNSATSVQEIYDACTDQKTQKISSDCLQKSQTKIINLNKLENLCLGSKDPGCISKTQKEIDQQMTGVIEPFCKGTGFGGLIGRKGCEEVFRAKIEAGNRYQYQNKEISLRVDQIKQKCSQHPGSNFLNVDGEYYVCGNEFRKTTASEKQTIDKEIADNNRISGFCGRNRTQEGVATCYSAYKSIVDSGGTFDVNTGVAITKDGRKIDNLAFIVEKQTIAENTLNSYCGRFRSNLGLTTCQSGISALTERGGSFDFANGVAKTKDGVEIKDFLLQYEKSIGNAIDYCEGEKEVSKAICWSARSGVAAAGGKVDEAGRMFDENGNQLVVRGSSLVSLRAAASGEIYDLDKDCSLSNGCDVAKFASGWCAGKSGKLFSYTVSGKPVVSYCQPQSEAGTVGTFTRLCDESKENVGLNGCEQVKKYSTEVAQYIYDYKNSGGTGAVVPNMAEYTTYNEFVDLKKLGVSPGGYCADNHFGQGYYETTSPGKFSISTTTYYRCDGDGGFRQVSGLNDYAIGETVMCSAQEKAANGFGCNDYRAAVSTNKNDQVVFNGAYVRDALVSPEGVSEYLLRFLADNSASVTAGAPRLYAPFHEQVSWAVRKLVEPLNASLPDCTSGSSKANSAECITFRNNVKTMLASQGLPADAIPDCQNLETPTPGYWTADQCSRIVNYVADETNTTRRIVRGSYDWLSWGAPVGGASIQNFDPLASFVGNTAVQLGTLAGVPFVVTRALPATAPAFGIVGPVVSGFFMGVGGYDLYDKSQTKAVTLEALGIPCDITNGFLGGITSQLGFGGEPKFNCGSSENEEKLVERMKRDSAKGYQPFKPEGVDLNNLTEGDFDKLADQYLKYLENQGAGVKTISELNAQIDGAYLNLAVNVAAEAIQFKVIGSATKKPITGGAGEENLIKVAAGGETLEFTPGSNVKIHQEGLAGGTLVFDGKINSAAQLKKELAKISGNGSVIVTTPDGVKSVVWKTNERPKIGGAENRIVLQAGDEIRFVVGGNEQVRVLKVGEQVSIPDGVNVFVYRNGKQTNAFVSNQFADVEIQRPPAQNAQGGIPAIAPLPGQAAAQIQPPGTTSLTENVQAAIGRTFNPKSDAAEVLAVLSETIKKQPGVIGFERVEATGLEKILQSVTDRLGFTPQVARLTVSESAPQALQEAVSEFNKAFVTFTAATGKTPRENQLRAFLQQGPIKQLSAGGGKTSVLSHLENALNRKTVAFFKDATDARTYADQVAQLNQPGFYENLGIDTYYYDFHKGFRKIESGARFDLDSARVVSADEMRAVLDSAAGGGRGVLVVSDGSGIGHALAASAGKAPRAEVTLIGEMLSQKREFTGFVDEIGEQMGRRLSVSEGELPQIGKLGQDSSELLGLNNAQKLLQVSREVRDSRSLTAFRKKILSFVRNGQSAADEFFRFGEDVVVSKPFPKDERIIAQSYDELLEQSLQNSPSSAPIRSELEAIHTNYQEALKANDLPKMESLRRQVDVLTQRANFESVLDQETIADLAFRVANIKDRWATLFQNPNFYQYDVSIKS